MLHHYLSFVVIIILLTACNKQFRSDFIRNPRLVSPANLRGIEPGFFNEDELDLPYYLIHFHQLANGVVLKGKKRGFIDISVWRKEEDNMPYNARIMENILSLAYFYGNQRPWNPYYGSVDVRFRLEAALNFWCEIQSPEGKFSEYGPEKWNLAATAFATKFMGESLHWLEQGPAISKELLERVKAADRKAIYLVLTDEDFYDFGKNYSNQYSNVWAGALAYLDLYPDAEIRKLLFQRLEQSMEDFQSTAGYFYEAGGPDWSYNLGTHHSNLHMAFHYAKDPEIRKMLATKDRAFSEWLAYNSVPQIGGEGYILNRGIETRQLRPSFERYGWFLSQGMPLTEVDSLSHAFVLNQEEVEEEIESAGRKLRREWPRTIPLPVGEFSAYSPYTFLYRNHDRYYPTPLQQQEALSQLPVNRPPFVHQRYDTRNQTVYTYIRTKKYYATFNAGEKLRKQQRYGLGLVWSPVTGAVLQTQTAETLSAWGIRVHPDSLPLEARSLKVNYFMDEAPVPLQSGNRDLPGSQLNISYDLQGKGTRKLEFLPDRIRISLAYPGTFFEHVPVLVPQNELLIIQSDKLLIPGANEHATLKFENDTPPEIIPTQIEIGEKKIICLKFKAVNELVYEVGF